MGRGLIEDDLTSGALKADLILEVGVIGDDFLLCWCDIVHDTYGGKASENKLRNPICSHGSFVRRTSWFGYRADVGETSLIESRADDVVWNDSVLTSHLG